MIIMSLLETLQCEGMYRSEIRKKIVSVIVSKEKELYIQYQSHKLWTQTNTIAV